MLRFGFHFGGGRWMFGTRSRRSSRQAARKRSGRDDVDFGWLLLLFARHYNRRLGGKTATAHARVHHLTVAARRVPFQVGRVRMHRLQTSPAGLLLLLLLLLFRCICYESKIRVIKSVENKTDNEPIPWRLEQSKHNIVSSSTGVGLLRRFRRLPRGLNPTSEPLWVPDQLRNRLRNSPPH